jgi:hypothetical protein
MSLPSEKSLSASRGTENVNTVISSESAQYLDSAVVLREKQKKDFINGNWRMSKAQTTSLSSLWLPSKALTGPDLDLSTSSGPTGDAFE